MPQPEPEPEPPAKPAAPTCGRCCAGLRACGVALLVAFAAVYAQRAVENTALDGLQCGPAGQRHLSDAPFHGMHVLTAGDGDGAAVAAVCTDGAASFRVAVSVDGSPSVHETATDASCDPAAELGGLTDWVRERVPRERAALHARLRASGWSAAALEHLGSAPAPSGSGSPRWGYFTPHGTPVAADARSVVAAFRECGTLYLFEGGSFMWPGISVGHNTTVRTRRQYLLGGKTEYTLTTLSLVVRFQ